VTIGQFSRGQCQIVGDRYGLENGPRQSLIEDVLCDVLRDVPLMLDALERSFERLHNTKLYTTKINQKGSTFSQLTNRQIKINFSLGGGWVFEVGCIVS